jgi:hypothetical protein
VSFKTKPSSSRTLRLAVVASVFAFVVANLLALRMVNALADAGNHHRIRNLNFGVSGSNVNDASSAFCCGGTLGALVQDSQANQYILSNNHVLGRSGQANPGDNIAQPGLIDNFCRPAVTVANFTLAPSLSSNVDAAIAKLAAGMMNSDGSIEDIGTISAVMRTPSVGLNVAKSGRTTGFTTGSISSINTSVSVQYQEGCGRGKKFTVSYTNQVVVTGNSFSAGGDSGSLIVTNDSANQPVALLFAGSKTTTIGNPIQSVMAQISNALGSTVSFVGNAEVSAQGSSAQPSIQSIQNVHNTHGRRADALMRAPGVIGVGIGVSDDGTEAALVIYVDNAARQRPNFPDRVDGALVKVVVTDPFVAF